jgi:acetylglutamate kinase
MKEALSIVKIGGNIIGDKKVLPEFLDLFAQLPGPKILVHGGGKSATALGARLGIKAHMINGRRITDAANLELAVMVYAGLLNKGIVAGLQALDCNAIGLCGADGKAISAHKRPIGEIDFGYVGDIDGVNAPFLSVMLKAGLSPVFCALTDDGKGQLLNTNADTIASEIAIGLSGEYNTTLYYCFEKQGVLRNLNEPGSVIREINTASYQQLLKAGIIAEGMLPKMENCFNALKRQVGRVCIGDMKMFTEGHTLFTTLRL